MLKTIKT